MTEMIQSRLKRGAAAFAACLALGSFAAASAQADFGFKAFDGTATADAAGEPYTQAGGHPYEYITDVEYNTHEEADVFGVPIADEDTKNIFVDLPSGTVGNPAGIPTCRPSDFYSGPGWGITNCPIDSVVGRIAINFFGFYEYAPLFNLEPGREDTPAILGFDFLGVYTLIEASVRSGSDYGVTMRALNISQGLPINGQNVEVWGVPAMPSFDKYRCARLQAFSGECQPESYDPLLRPHSAEYEPAAFMTLPTTCTAAGKGLEGRARMESWQHPGAFVNASYETHLPPGFPLPPDEWGAPQGPTGCENVPFEPTFKATPTTNAAESPSGLEVDITVPQAGLLDPNGIAQSHLRTATVKLPAGMTVNPSSADGLGSCSPAQIGLGETGPAACPDASKIGQVQIDTPVLKQPLTGSVYLAQQGDNPFKSLLALYMVAEGSGVVVKLPGRVVADPATGQLTAAFDDDPQLPFSRLHVSLKGGPRAPLMTPPKCGEYAVQSSLVPWSGNPPVNQASSFEVTSGPGGSPCPSGGFDPKLNAGTTSPIAGTHSPFVLRLSREDGSRQIDGMKVTLPKGLVGTLVGIPYCSDAALAGISGAEGTGAGQIASSGCPAASEVGTVTVGAGAGSTPLYVKTGRAYLTGPYKGAPLSLAIVTPAVAGPFDLGNVVVRTALNVDPESTAITAVSDPLPTILHGIPLDLRSVEVDLGRPGFTLNPTSCAPMSVDATVSGVGGASAGLSNPFQVGNCADLPFQPKLALKVKGGTERTDYPALSATLTARPGDANIGRAAVTLPHSEFLAQSHIRTICTRVQFAADQCPPGSVYGYAKAITPLLEQPLEGPVYLRSSNNKLPDLVAALHGQIDVDLVGRIDSVHGGIRNTFELVPDAPVTKFTLTMQGGKKGLLENSRNLCNSVNRATVLLDAQNGKTADQRPIVGNDCRKQKRQAKKGKRAGHKRAGTR